MNSYEGEPADQELVKQRLAEAERLLFGLCPSARLRAQSEDTLPLVQDVIIRAVLRTLRVENPTMRSESEGNYSYTRDALSASGNLWFPREDLAALGCGSRGGKVGSTSVRPSQTFAPTGVPRRRYVHRGGGWW